MRIVSLVPSLTELIADLGLAENLIGRTRFCIHPSDVMSTLPIVGGTKNPQIEGIRQLEPDLVIANKEENRKEDVDEIRTFCEVEVTDVNTIEEALMMIHDLGRLTGTSAKASEICDQIQQLLPKTPYSEIRTAYLIWMNPLMSVGNDTYIHHIMERWGLINIYGDKTRYPELSDEDLIQSKPELLLLSSEPYPFREKHLAMFKEMLPETRTELVNGEWFSWYGSRMAKTFGKLTEWREGL